MRTYVEIIFYKVLGAVDSSEGNSYTCVFIFFCFTFSFADVCFSREFTNKYTPIKNAVR